MPSHLHKSGDHNAASIFNYQSGFREEFKNTTKKLKNISELEASPNRLRFRGQPLIGKVLR